MNMLMSVIAAFILLITTTFAHGLKINVEQTQHLETEYEDIIFDICNKYNEDSNLVKAIIRVESRYNPKAVSVNKQCKGMMQLSQGTARKFDVKNVFCPYDNIEGGVKYLQHLRSIFGNDITRILASYNVGEGKVYKQKIPTAGFNYAKLVLACKDVYDKRPLTN